MVEDEIDDVNLQVFESMNDDKYVLVRYPVFVGLTGADDVEDENVDKPSSGVKGGHLRLFIQCWVGSFVDGGADVFGRELVTP